MNRVFLLSLSGMYIYLIFYLKCWQRIGPGFGITDNFFALMALITLIGLTVSCLGIMTHKRWALYYFSVFNILFLIGGFIAVYVSWILWFWGKPSLFDRLKSAFLPFMVGIVVPTILIYYAAKKKREKF